MFFFVNICQAVYIESSFPWMLLSEMRRSLPHPLSYIVSLIQVFQISVQILVQLGTGGIVLKHTNVDVMLRGSSIICVFHFIYF